jgi:hypothetical protein
MAKKQTFGDKLKKGEAAEKFPVKVLKWFQDENRGTLRLKEKLVMMDSPNDVTKVDI